MGATHVGSMSLNRSEQLVFDYVQTHAEERHHWMEKVRKAVAANGDEHAAAAHLAGELWHYYEERSAVVTSFREIAVREGLRRISMKNLAEYLIRVWTVPRPKKSVRAAEA